MNQILASSLKRKKTKKVLYPPIKQLKSFAKTFSKKDWHLLCLNKDFLQNILEDLPKAKHIAYKILHNHS